MPRESSIAELAAVAARHIPRGWKYCARPVQAKADKNGLETVAYADFATKTIVCPPLTSRLNLAYFLHECGHVHQRHDVKNKVPPYTEEYEADQYAIRAMRAAGVPVPREFRRSAWPNLMAAMPKDGDYSEVPAAILKFLFGREWRKHR